VRHRWAQGLLPGPMAPTARYALVREDALAVKPANKNTASAAE
jgi:hypothetical protein